jgi:hypothetical protein
MWAASIIRIWDWKPAILVPFDSTSGASPLLHPLEWPLQDTPDVSSLCSPAECHSTPDDLFIRVENGKVDPCLMDNLPIFWTCRRSGSWILCVSRRPVASEFIKDQSRSWNHVHTFIPESCTMRCPPVRSWFINPRNIQ